MSRPYVVLNSAMSLDGKIATRAGRARISSDEDMARTQALRASMDGIMIGINTLLVDDPSLRVKVPREGDPPARIIVDSRLRTPAKARIFSFPGRIFIGTSERAEEARIARLSDRAEIIVRGRETVDLGALLEDLERRGIKRLLLEGGGTLNWSMIRGGYVDEIRVAIAPMVIGGRDAVTLAEGDGISDVREAPGLELVNVERMGGDLVLTYRTGARLGA